MRQVSRLFFLVSCGSDWLEPSLVNPLIFLSTLASVFSLVMILFLLILCTLISTCGFEYTHEDLESPRNSVHSKPRHPEFELGHTTRLKADRALDDTPSYN